MSENNTDQNKAINENMETPLFSFGIITDIQHADIPDGSNFKKTKPRYYRNSVNILNDAVDCWQKSNDKIEFVLQLGDVIDGYNKDTPGASEAALARTMDVFSRLDCPVYHAIGNHELYNFKRTALVDTLLNSTRSPLVSSPDDINKIYYHFSPLPGFRVVVLDTYDVSLLGHDKESEEYCETLKSFREINQNEESNDPNGLPREKCMYAAYNGGISEVQLAWLDKVLTAADANQERVIIAGHDPIHHRSTSRYCLLWNHGEVLDVIDRHPTSVMAYLAGHWHSSGYKRDKYGIHHVTFKAVVDTPPGNQCHAIAHVYGDRIEIIGYGDVVSRTLKLIVNK